MVGRSLVDKIAPIGIVQAAEEGGLLIVGEGDGTQTVKATEGCDMGGHGADGHIAGILSQFAI